MKRFVPFVNREQSLAVFLFATLLLLAACGQPDKKTDAAADEGTSDIYTLEVKKDRLEKDKYLP